MPTLNLSTPEIRALSIACDIATTKGQEDMSDGTRLALLSAHMKITRMFIVPAALRQARQLLDKIYIWDGQDEVDRARTVRLLDEILSKDEAIEPPASG